MLRSGAASLPARTRMRASGVTMRAVKNGRKKQVPIVSPAMLCGPQSGTEARRLKRSQAMPALRAKLTTAAPTPCSSSR